MSDPSDSAVKLAELLGVVQEARRLEHRRVGSEHLLMATCSDPIVRGALAAVGCDMRDVQRLVAQAAPEPGAGATTPSALTPVAVELITRATAEVGDLDLDHPPDPRLFSMLLGLVMITLLRDEQDTASRRILDELGLRQHTERLSVSIRRESGPSALPKAQ